VTKPQPDRLVDQAFNAPHDELARAVEKLSPAEAQHFLNKLEAAMRKRKVQIVGYLVAMFAWIAAMMLALVWYATHDGFAGWVFVVPFGIVGAILYGFGKWAERVGSVPAK
jgi:hypothetical protein